MPIIKHTSLIILALLFGVIVWLGYLLVDQSVTLEHHRQYTQQVKKQRDLLYKLVVATKDNMNEAQVKKIIQSEAKDSIFAKEEDQTVASRISFSFSQGKLAGIEMDE